MTSLAFSLATSGRQFCLKISKFSCLKASLRSVLLCCPASCDGASSVISVKIIVLMKVPIRLVETIIKLCQFFYLGCR